MIIVQPPSSFSQTSMFLRLANVRNLYISQHMAAHHPPYPTPSVHHRKWGTDKRPSWCHPDLAQQVQHEHLLSTPISIRQGQIYRFFLFLLFIHFLLPPAS